MSYEETMNETINVWDQKTHSYKVTHRDLTKMPLSKLPIAKRLLRAIHERLSFSNIQSSNSTAIRWKGDYYIVSFRPLYSPESTMDIAVGRKDEVPFMFHSPFVGDPCCGKVYHYYWNNDYSSGKNVLEKATPTECYSHYVNMSISNRLADLGIFIHRQKMSVGTILNEKTNRVNKIYANVPVIDIYKELVNTFPIGMSNYEIIRQNCTATCENRYGELIVDTKPKCVPLLKSAWYFRDGTIASETQDKTIKL